MMARSRDSIVYGLSSSLPGPT
ncbi:hypothetical protein RSAG8_13898, partial [Rhizoctonia solani AG-8 WAC10335]